MKKEFRVSSDLSKVQETSSDVLGFLKPAGLSESALYDIRLCLEEALINAMKYGNGAPIEISLDGDGEVARLSVTDHGIGIDKERQKRLFMRFERAVTGQRYGGFGLGLWITRQLVEAMQGQISVDSRPGQGSTFSVTIPFGPSPTASVNAVESVD